MSFILSFNAQMHSLERKKFTVTQDVFCTEIRESERNFVCSEAIEAIHNIARYDH